MTWSIFPITHPYTCTCIYEFIRISFKDISGITNKNSPPYLTWWKEAGVTSNQAKVLHWGTMDLTMFLGWPCSETGKNRRNRRTPFYIWQITVHSVCMYVFGIQISLKIVPKVPINNKSALVHLTLKHWETHECVVSTVATDALVLKHQAISIHNAD